MELTLMCSSPIRGVGPLGRASVWRRGQVSIRHYTCRRMMEGKIGAVPLSTSEFLTTGLPLVALAAYMHRPTLVDIIKLSRCRLYELQLSLTRVQLLYLYNFSAEMTILNAN